MNAAKRIENVLKLIPNTSERQALKVFEKIFSVSGCHAVSNKLYIISTQVDMLHKKGVSKELTRYLYNMFSCYNLARDIAPELQNLPSIQITLETASALMPSDMDNIDTNDLTELSDMIEQLRKKLESGSIPDEYKSIIDSFLNEIRDAITDIEYGGMEAFAPHVETAFGKFLVYHGAFEKSGVLQEVNDIYAKTTKIMDDLQIWAGVIGYTIGKLSQ